jgi:gliding motility-associated-like protein
VVFNNKSTLPVGNNTVTWQFGDGDSSTLSTTTVKHLYASANAYSVKLKIATDNGCSDSMQTQVEVYTNPQTAFNVDTVCFGLASEFKNSTQISKGNIASYLWDLGNGKTSIEHNPVIKYDHPATFNVKLKATSDKGCAIEIQKTARVNPQPVAKFEAESVCDGEPVSFNNKTEIQSGAINYLWNFGNEKSSTQTNEVVIYDKAGRYEVKLLAKTPQGCADSVGKAVWSYALPQPFILAESDSLSKGFGTQLIGQGGKVYSWTPQESVSDPNARITIAKPQENTVYTLTVLDSNGCGASTSKSIRVYEDFILVASNVITPDNNGKNDTWFVKNTEAYDNVKVFIADRWGREVYTSDDYQNDWAGVNNAGEQLPDGNYYYIITHNSSDKVYKGTITLMRNN